MLGAVGDLVEDVVVRFSGGPAPDSGPRPDLTTGQLELALGADTPVTVVRRQGGSAANVCVAAATAGHRARFLGQLGDDATGRSLAGELRARGVEVTGHQGGRSGTVVVLCHPDGERSMLTDRGSSRDLDDPDPAWLDGLAWLHVPLYSLAGGLLARSTRRLARWATERGVARSLDLSSTAVLRDLGPPGLSEALDAVRPQVVLANEAEAATAATLVELARPGVLVVVKRGPAPARLLRAGRSSLEVPARPLGPVADTTGAGDAFAAGFLVALSHGLPPEEAVGSGHQLAAQRLRWLQDGADRDAAAASSTVRSPGGSSGQADAGSAR